MHRHGGKRSFSALLAKTKGLLFAAALLCISPASGEGAVMHNEPDVRVQAAFQVAVRSDYKEANDYVERQRALVLTTNVGRVSTAQTSSAGLVFEYSRVDDGRDTLLLGGMFTRKTGKWAAAASPLYKGTLRTGTGHCYWWGSLRRQVAPRHSLGVEVLQPIRSDKPAKWLLGYGGTISESVSVSLAFGAELGDGADRVARGSVVWRPRVRQQ